MSEYRLDLNDDAARAFVYDLRNDGSDLEKEVARQIEEQIPLPAPTKFGAIVLTKGEENGGRYIRWTHDAHTHSPWILAHDHETPYRTDQIGRIVEVLFEGVDL